MREFWRKAESVWNNDRRLAWILVLVGTGLASWAGIFPRSPGVSIGLLAGVAGIMSVRPKMHPAEKFAWVAVLVTFTILEVLAIGRADKAAEVARTAQNSAFTAIVEELKAANSQSEKQYGSTITHVDTVLSKTEEAAGAAKEGVANLTGSDSYLDVFPMGKEPPFLLVAAVLGTHMVWDAQVNMREGGYVDLDFYRLPVVDKIFLKPIPPRQLVPLGRSVTPPSGKDGQYGFKIDSRGTMGVEDLTIRLNPKDKVWEYETWIWTAKTSKKKPTGLTLVKHLGWQPISPPLMVGSQNDKAIKGAP